MPRAYEGDKPYIFISYSHKDSKIVMSVIRYLQKHNFRVWYDGGIEAGSEWPEYIASHLKRCECVLSFISEHFVDSLNCRRELVFAQDERKPMMNVFIGDVELSDGMRMQLGLNQAIWKKNFMTDEEFAEAICRAQMIKACKETEVKPQPPKPAPTPAASEPPKASEAAPVSEESEKREPAPAHKAAVKTAAPSPKPASPKAQPPKEKETPKEKKVKGFVKKLTVALELSYVLFGSLSLSAVTAKSYGFWLTVLAVCGLHLAIIIANCTIIRMTGKKLNVTENDDVGVGLFLGCCASSILAVVIGTFCIGYDIHFVLKFLVALGLNIVPAGVGIVAYSVCGFSSGKK